MNDHDCQLLIKLHDKWFRRWITAEEIEVMVQRIGRELNDVLPMEDDVVMLGVLSGSVFFYVDLIRHLSRDVHMDFVHVKSYDGMESSGRVHMGEVHTNITDRHVVIVEDIIDSGRSIMALKKRLRSFKPKSIMVVALFYKPEADRYHIPPDLVGKNIANDFIVGFGLDYDGLGRNLKDVYRVARTAES